MRATGTKSSSVAACRGASATTWQLCGPPGGGPLCEFWFPPGSRASPPGLGEGGGAPARLERLGARRRALQSALHHALQDRGDPEQIVGEIEIPMLYLPAPGAPAV